MQTFASQICFGVTSPSCINSASGTGSVTSVAVTAPTGVFALSGSPVTTSGTIALTFNTQAANQFFSGPVNGSPGVPAFRAMVIADLPVSGVTAGSYTAANITVNAAGQVTAATSGGGSGTVTSVAMTVPSWLSVAGSPITTSGTLAVTGASQAANVVLASPDGSSGAVTPRALVSADIPSLSSLYCALGGCTLTGPLVLPAGSASAADLNGGTTNTGVFFPTSSASAFTVTGTEVARFNSSGLQIGSTTTTDALYVKQNLSTDTGLVLANSNNTRAFGFDYSSAGGIAFGKTGSNDTFAISDSTAGNTGVGWISISGNGPEFPPSYPQEFNAIATDGAITALSSFIPFAGGVANGLPIVVMRNASSTVNTLAGFFTAGSSRNLMGGIFTRVLTQTSGVEAAEVALSNQNAGTNEEHLRIKTQGLWESGGTAPTVTCNGNAATVETGSSSVYARFTIPATPGTSCTVTIPDTADSKPICEVTDEGISALEVMVCSSTTSCTITDTGMVAANTIAFHCGAHK